MLKNESARNATKPVPLRPSRLPDSGGIIFIVKRSPYGEDIAFCPPSQTGKILDADCTCPYSPYRHVSVRTADVACPYGDVAVPEHDTWQRRMMTRGSTGR
jgi:hypothetical protein